jgi:hypothetical protein
MEAVLKLQFNEPRLALQRDNNVLNYLTPKNLQVFLQDAAAKSPEKLLEKLNVPQKFWSAIVRGMLPQGG